MVTYIWQPVDLDALSVPLHLYVGQEALCRLVQAERPAAPLDGIPVATLERLVELAILGDGDRSPEDPAITFIRGYTAGVRAVNRRL